MDLFGCISTLAHEQKSIDLIAVDPKTMLSLQTLSTAQKNWISQQNFTAEVGTFIAKYTMAVSFCSLVSAEGMLASPQKQHLKRPFVEPHKF